jgi:hypothetical protein
MVASSRRMCYRPSHLDAGLAQLVEHLICNQGVGGSNPSAGTEISYFNKLELAPVASREASETSSTRTEMRFAMA